MIGWTIFNWFCFGVCLIFMFVCDKDYLSNLLKYNAATAIYIFSFVNACRTLPWELSDDVMTGSQFLCMLAVCGSAIAYVSSFFTMAMGDGLPNFKFIKRYLSIDENNPRINYKLFKQMYALHPDKFHFCNYSWDYNFIDFSLNFFDYFRASFLIENEEKGPKSRDRRKDYQRLVSEMQADLEKDLVAARKEKEQAFQEIEDATKDAHELFKALSKYN
ncbi:Uncharacterised protein [Chlamydia trachomatis]|nr:Uncharacterised protein [Chlamydia trachomatis]